jgi:hypothetical protein
MNQYQERSVSVGGVLVLVLDRLLSLLLADPLVRCEGCGEHVHPEELEAGHECYDGAHA